MKIFTAIPVLGILMLFWTPSTSYNWQVTDESGTSLLDLTCPKCPPCTAIDGSWGTWSPWSNCSKLCGGGDRQRTRGCHFPAPDHRGSNCSGHSSGQEDCNTQDCPIDGSWGSWGSWSGCSKTCCTGRRQRTRGCTAPAPAHQGRACQGSTTAYENCNTQDCPKYWTGTSSERITECQKDNFQCKRISMFDYYPASRESGCKSRCISQLGDGCRSILYKERKGVPECCISTSTKTSCTDDPWGLGMSFGDSRSEPYKYAELRAHC